MLLSHSRYRNVEFTFSQDQVRWAQLHINAFNFSEPDIYDPTLIETYSELPRFYGFTIDPAKVYKPVH